MWRKKTGYLALGLALFITASASAGSPEFTEGVRAETFRAAESKTYPGGYVTYSAIIANGKADGLFLCARIPGIFRSDPVGKALCKQLGMKFVRQTEVTTRTGPLRGQTLAVLDKNARLIEIRKAVKTGKPGFLANLLYLGHVPTSPDDEYMENPNMLYNFTCKSNGSPDQSAHRDSRVNEAGDKSEKISPDTSKEAPAQPGGSTDATAK